MQCGPNPCTRFKADQETEPQGLKSGRDSVPGATVTPHCLLESGLITVSRRRRIKVRRSSPWSRQTTLLGDGRGGSRAGALGAAATPSMSRGGKEGGFRDRGRSPDGYSGCTGAVESGTFLLRLAPAFTRAQLAPDAVVEARKHGDRGRGAWGTVPWAGGCGIHRRPAFRG